MKKRKQDVKRRLNTELCGIKKSIKEEMEDIKDKLEYRECFKLEEKATLFDKILYWIFFIIGTLLCIYVFSDGKSNNVAEFTLVYITLNLFLAALFYTYRCGFTKKLYIAVSKPLRVLLAYLFKVLGINYSVQHSLKCFGALVVSSFCSILVFSRLPNCIPVFEDIITSKFPNAEVALHMCILCSMITSILVGMLVMYILLRAMLVVCVTGDRKCKLDIFKKIWNEMKLMFYLFATILQFWGMVEGVLSVEGDYLLESVLFIMVVDQYYDKRNE